MQRSEAAPQRLVYTDVLLDSSYRGHRHAHSHTVVPAKAAKARILVPGACPRERSKKQVSWFLAVGYRCVLSTLLVLRLEGLEGSRLSSSLLRQVSRLASSLVLMHVNTKDTKTVLEFWHSWETSADLTP